VPSACWPVDALGARPISTTAGPAADRTETTRTPIADVQSRDISAYNP
jgi:hypothetical protein